MNHAYLQTPSLAGDTLIFMTDDDLWSVSRFGGMARRLTTDEGRPLRPCVSPDKSHIAYLANNHGQYDLYIIPLQGGVAKRITYHGVSKISGWKDNQTIIISSDQHSFTYRVGFLKEVNIHTGNIKDINLGPASCLYKNGKKQLLGRNIGDPARWKRYRGGTAGTLWVDLQGNNNFSQILTKLKTNLANPMWIDDRIYFISDHEGIGNIYSCNEKGHGLKRHTHQDEFYVRSFTYDQGILVYQVAGDLYQLELKSKAESKIEINVVSSFAQSKERFEYADDFLQDFDISNAADEIIISSRGKLLLQAPWGEAPFHLGDLDKRYKHPTFVKDHILAVELDDQHEETLVIFDEDELTKKTLAKKHSWGKIYQVAPSPEGNKVVIITNRGEIWLVDIPSGKVKLVEKSKHHFSFSVNWSPCSEYITFDSILDNRKTAVKVYELSTAKSKVLITPINKDSSPVFSPCGRYLFFIGIREFHPMHLETHFEYCFQGATRPYVVNLTADTPTPMDLFLNFSDDEDDEDEKTEHKEKSKKKKKKEKTKINWQGIEHRITPIPVELGGYVDLYSAKDRIFFLHRELEGNNPYGSHWSDDHSGYDLYSFCFKENKKELFQSKVSDLVESRDKKFFLVTSDDRLRIIHTDSKPSDGEGNNKKDGWIDFDRTKFRHDPKAEWRQMYKEAWILQREQFWSPDMSKIDWEKVYLRYLPLLEKVNTRYELSDLLWEMQGELGTSHAYEIGGDYHRRPPGHYTGFFAARFKANPKSKNLEIVEMAKGSSWIDQERSPLLAPEVGLKPGDQILGVNGIKVQTQLELERECEGKADQKINLEVKRKGKKDSEFVLVKLLSDFSNTRYRDWVEKNKEYVHKKSNGKLGYVHIPDMHLKGYSEFYRHFISECQYEGLVVDVRYNGGGHISQHILKIIAQKTLGFDQTRYSGIEPYPLYSINGPLVCITNEHAGSDGDIFSHSFKLMKLGKLIGKRTWGGVIGIWPKVGLNDGTITTQPEYSFWFKDVGWKVENYGAEPDIEVEILPQDWRKNKDPQMDKAIEVALKELKQRPSLKAKFEKKPNLKLPKLPRS
jgi:tricorn protease